MSNSFIGGSMATTQNKAGGRKTARSVEQDVKINVSEGLPSEKSILIDNPFADQKADNSNSNEFTDEQNIQSTPSDTLTDDQRREHISVAAYYNAEKRGFSGDEQQQLDDWLEAEKFVGNYYTGGTATNREQQPVQQIINESEAPLDDSNARSDKQEVIDPSEVKRWAKDLGVSATTLREAINRVGANVNDVKSFLSKVDTTH